MRFPGILLVGWLLGAHLLAGMKSADAPELLPPAKLTGKAYELSNEGVILLRAGKLKEAEAILKQALGLDPKDGFCHSTLGIVYFSEGKYDDAVSELTTALATDAKNATAHNYLGIASFQKGTIGATLHGEIMTANQKRWQDAAVKELETATTLDPNYADAHFNLAVVLATKARPDKEASRMHYERALALGAEKDLSLEGLIGISEKNN